MTVYKNDNLYDRSNVAIKNGEVVNYDKTNHTEEMKWIDAGINLFEKSILSDVPKNTIYPLEKLIVKLIEDKQLIAWECNERFYEIGSLGGLKEFREKIGRESTGRSKVQQLV